MATWECPACGRTFGRKGRSHMCNPGITVEEYVAGGHPLAGPVHDRIVGHLQTLDGELIVDPVGAGILYKHDSTFAMLTSKKKWVALGVMLRRKLESPRVSLKVSEQNGRFWHTFNLHDAAEIDAEMCDWLTEAFLREPIGEVANASWDPMVPDDVDLGPLG